MSDIKDTYGKARASYISYDKIMDILYGQNIKYKTEALYNASAVYRYMIPIQNGGKETLWSWNPELSLTEDINNAGGNNVNAAQGNRLPLTKYWNYNRQTFLDSCYEGSG